MPYDLETTHGEAVSPPFSNRGGKPSDFTPTLPEVPCLFDYYGATIPQPVETITQSFLNHFGGDFETCNAHHGYESALSHKATGVLIYWGGRNPHPHLKSSGGEAQEVADWMRAAFPHHFVSRADVAIDFTGRPLLFDDLCPIVNASADRARVISNFVGDLRENDPEMSYEERRGRTLYRGNRKHSPAFVRLYEKGLEQRGKGNEDCDPYLIRLELEYKPEKKPEKARLATLEPFEVLGVSKWVARAVSDLVEETPAHLPKLRERGKTVEHTIDHMASQYSNAIREYVEKYGWPALTHSLYRHAYTQKERNTMERETNSAEREEHWESEPAAGFLEVVLPKYHPGQD